MASEFNWLLDQFPEPFLAALLMHHVDQESCDRERLFVLSFYDQTKRFLGAVIVRAHGPVSAGLSAGFALGERGEYPGGDCEVRVFDGADPEIPQRDLNRLLSQSEAHRYRCVSRPIGGSA